MSNWIFKLFVNNRTDSRFVINSSHLHWGVWYRNEDDDSAPMSIEPHSHAEVLGVRAARGSATGYECSCRWQDKDSSIYLTVDVPYSTSNSSSLSVEGYLKSTGWTPITKDGHYFERSITIYYQLEGEIGIHDDNDPEDIEYIKYQEMMDDHNDLVKNWDKLKDAIETIEDYDPLRRIPAAYRYPPKSIFFGKSEVFEIKKKDWHFVNDPVYTQDYQKQEQVESYFATAVYSVNTDPRVVKTIPAGQSETTETTVEVVSSIKSTLEQYLSIRALIGYNPAEAAGGVKAELETTFSISNTYEESSSRLDRETKTITIEAADYDRLFVQWLFSTALLIYRKDKAGKVTLLGISEWPSDVIDKVYKY